MNQAVTRNGVFAYVLAASVIVLDQLSKLWIVDVLRLPERGSVDVAGPFRLTFVQNVGVSFGFFGTGAEWVRWALAAFSLIVAVGLAIWARRLDRPILGLSVGLVMGGAIGNLIDRVRFGWVVDFVDVQALRFPWVFNLADSAISVGVTLLVLESLLAPRKPAAT